MNVACIHILQAFSRERVGFGKHSLRAVVHIGFVAIFEVNSVAARNHIHVDARSAQVVNGAHLALGKAGDKLVADGWQFANGVRNIVRCSAVQICGFVGSDYLVECDVTYAANINHAIMYLLFKRMLQNTACKITKFTSRSQHRRQPMKHFRVAGKPYRVKMAR